METGKQIATPLRLIFGLIETIQAPLPWLLIVTLADVLSFPDFWTVWLVLILRAKD